MEEKKVGCIYARISPTRKEQNEFMARSILNQLEKCRRQAIADEIIIFKEYIDQYVSGKSQEYMISFKEMIEDARNNKFKIIYCLKIDRFGRNQLEMLNTQKDLERLGIIIKFVEQGIDTGSNIGKMLLGMLGSFAEWQREDIITKTRLGRELAYKKNPEKFGRKKKEIDWDIVNSMINQKIEDKSIYSWRKISLKTGVSVTTLIRRYKKKHGQLPKRRA